MASLFIEQQNTNNESFDKIKLYTIWAMTRVSNNVAFWQV